MTWTMRLDINGALIKTPAMPPTGTIPCHLTGLSQRVLIWPDEDAFVKVILSDPLLDQYQFFVEEIDSKDSMLWVNLLGLGWVLEKTIRLD